MAIQIRSIGANRDVVSVSLSASVSDSPAKLSVTTLGDRAYRNSSIGSIGGISFAGQLVSYSTRKEQGKTLTTHEYIDNSVYLDQSCIVLFRRGLGGKPINVVKTVRLPGIQVGYDRGVVTFSFRSQLRDIVVQRYAGYSSSGLGQEDWSSNPCDSSNVTYAAGQALSIIGAPGFFSGGGFRCSYEGTFRSVLSSIYTDMGVGYWWDWTKNKIVMIRNSSIGFSVPREGCGILSLDYGATREGVSSQSSWSFERWPSRKTEEATATITQNKHFEVDPIKHPNYPTVDEILEKACPPLSTYRNLISGNFKKLGWSIVSEFVFPTSISDRRWEEYLSSTFNLDLKNQTFKEALYEYLNIEGEGTFYLAYQLNNDIPQPESTSELYYGYDSDYESDSSSDGDEFSFRKITTSFNPEQTQRGKNPYASTFEDQNGIIRRGLWRGVSEHVYGDTDAEDFALSVEDCIKTVPHDVLCKLVDRKVLPDLVFMVPKENPSESVASKYSSLKEDIELTGKQIIFVKSPRFSITVLGGGSETNPNDLSDVFDYEDPNAIIDQPPAEDKPEIVDECADVVPNLNNPNLDIQDEELKPGLASATGEMHKITCNGKTITVVMPSFSKYKIVRSTTSEFFRARQTGFAAAINSWKMNGGTRSDYGLSHRVSITDITPDENEAFSSFDVPSQIGGASTKWLQTLSAECDGFFLPIVPGLDSLSASLDSRGLRVSYSYKEIPIRPTTFRITNSIKRVNSSSTAS